MSYLTEETSQQDGKPVELYRFVIGGVSYEYTSAIDPITRGSLTYQPIAIQRSDDPQGPEERTSEIEIELPGDNPFAALFYGIVPGVIAQVTISRFHRDDPLLELITVFKGLVASVAFEDDSQVAKIAALPITAATSRPVPRFGYSALCNHVLYDERCKILDTDSNFRLVGEVTDVDDVARTIDVAGADSKPDGWYTGGFAEAMGGFDKRMVIAHVGTTITLHLPFAVNPFGADVVLFAGCDHTLPTCKSKFNNVINFGGFSFIPTRNIFSTGLQ